jgi:hypothetical protein
MALFKKSKEFTARLCMMGVLGRGDFEIELIVREKVWVRFTRVHRLYKEMISDPI